MLTAFICFIPLGSQSRISPLLLSYKEGKDDKGAWETGTLWIGSSITFRNEESSRKMKLHILIYLNNGNLDSFIVLVTVVGFNRRLKVSWDCSFTNHNRELFLSWVLIGFVALFCNTIVSTNSHLVVHWQNYMFTQTFYTHFTTTNNSHNERLTLFSFAPLPSHVLYNKYIITATA